MSTFLYRLGRISARHPFRVLGVWLVAAIAIGKSARGSHQPASTPSPSQT